MNIRNLFQNIRDLFQKLFRRMAIRPAPELTDGNQAETTAGDRAKLTDGNQANIERSVIVMPQTSLAKRAVTNFAVKAAPSIVAHVLGGGELSKVTNSICDTIKKVTCKDRIVLEEAIKANALMDAPTCNTFLNLLYDAIQVSVQSDCKDVSMVLEAIFRDSSAPLQEKVQYVLLLKQQQHEQWVEKVKTVSKGVVTVTVAFTVKEVGNMIFSQTPKILENQDKADKRDEDRKRLKDNQDADAQRRKDDFERDQARRQNDFAQERERRKAEEERRQADFQREQQRKRDDFAREQERRKAQEEERKANFAREQAQKQAHFEREQKRKQDDFAREQARRKAEAEQQAQAQNK